MSKYLIANNHSTKWEIVKGESPEDAIMNSEYFLSKGAIYLANNLATNQTKIFKCVDREHLLEEITDIEKEKDIEKH